MNQIKSKGLGLFCGKYEVLCKINSFIVYSSHRHKAAGRTRKWKYGHGNSIFIVSLPDYYLRICYLPYV